MRFTRKTVLVAITSFFVVAVIGVVFWMGPGQRAQSESMITAVDVPQNSGSSTEGRSLQDRVAQLEQQMNANSPRMNEKEIRKQQEQHLAEIRRMGLFERAQDDFNARLTNATVEQVNIGYLFNTNTVWCNVQYRLRGSKFAIMDDRTVREMSFIDFFHGHLWIFPYFLPSLLECSRLPDYKVTQIKPTAKK